MQDRDHSESTAAQLAEKKVVMAVASEKDAFEPINLDRLPAMSGFGDFIQLRKQSGDVAIRLFLAPFPRGSAGVTLGILTQQDRVADSTG